MSIAMDIPPVMLAHSLCRGEINAAARGQKLEHRPRPLGFGFAGEGVVCERQETERYARLPNGVAVISVDGPIWYAPHALSYWWGGESTMGLARALDQAASDDTIQTVLLDIHSPGGDVYGGSDLMAAAARCAGAKTLLAHCRDLCGSMAYWLACHAQTVYATPTASVGAIGTIAVLYDTEAAAAKEGVRPIVITDAELKASGHFGVPITDEMVQSLREDFLPAADLFRAAVSAGRKLSPDVIKSWKGKVFGAQAAKAAGLVDEVILSQDLYTRLTTPGAGPVETKTGPVGGAKAGPVADARGSMGAAAAKTPAAKANAATAGSPVSRRGLVKKTAAKAGNKDIACSRTRLGKDKTATTPRSLAMTDEEKTAVTESLAEMDEDTKKEMLAQLAAEFPPAEDEEEETADAKAEEEEETKPAARRKGPSPTASVLDRMKQVKALCKEAECPEAHLAAVCMAAIEEDLNDTQVVLRVNKINKDPSARADQQLASVAAGATEPLGGGRGKGGGTAAAGGSARARFNAAVEVARAEKRANPAAYVCQTQPELQKALIEEANAELKAKRQARNSAA